MIRSPRRMIRAALNQEGLVLITIGNIIAVVVGALTWLILAGMLPVSEYGRINYILSLGGLLAGFSALGLPLTVQTYLPKGEEGIVPPSIILVVLVSLLLSLPFLTFHPAVLLIVVSYALFSLALRERLGRKRYRDFAILQAASRVSIILAVIPSVLLWGSEAILYIFPSVYLIMSAWLLPRIKGAMKSLRDLRKHLNFALTAFLTGIVGTMGNRLDKVMIGALYGVETLGYYQLAFQLYTAMLVVPNSLSNYLLPEKSSGRGTRLAEIMGLMLTVLVALAGFLLAPFFVKKLFPRFYPPSAIAGQIVSLAIIFDSLFGIWTAGKYSREEPKEVLAVNLTSLGVFMALIYWLGSTMGVQGLAISLLVYRALASTLGLMESSING